MGSNLNLIKEAFSERSFLNFILCKIIHNILHTILLTHPNNLPTTASKSSYLLNFELYCKLLLLYPCPCVQGIVR